MSKPSHHFTAVWNSSGSRWKPSPMEGVTESHDAACLVETEYSLALSAGEDLSISCWNWKLSSFEDKTFWLQAKEVMELGDIFSEDATCSLNIPIARFKCTLHPHYYNILMKNRMQWMLYWHDGRGSEVPNDLNVEGAVLDTMKHPLWRLPQFRKHWRTAASNICRASKANGVGIARAKWLKWQKPPQIQMRVRATCGSLPAMSSSLDNTELLSFLAFWSNKVDTEEIVSNGDTKHVKMW